MLNKFLGICLITCSPFLFAGQGMFIKINSYLPNTRVKLTEVHCINGTEKIRPNATAYVEADNGCISNWVKFTILEKNLALVKYDINISYRGSKLFVYPFQHDDRVMVSTLYPHSGISGTQDRVTISIAHAEDDWMKKSANTIAKKPLSSIIIPGSHDTGTVGISSRSEITSDIDKRLKFWINLDPLKITHLSNWSVTQNFKITNQLNSGIRYLDLRLCKNTKGQVVTCHSISGTSLLQILNDVSAFLNQARHDKELIILDINHLYSIETSDIVKLIDLLKLKFGDKIAGRNVFSPNSLVQHFWDAKKQVIILIDNLKAAKEHPDIFWSEKDIYSPWLNKETPEEMKKNMQIILRDLHIYNQFFVLQSQETPSTKTIIDGFNPFSHNPDTLMKMTSLYKNAIENWLHEPGVKSMIKTKGNIIIEDFTNGIDLTEYAKSLN